MEQWRAEKYLAILYTLCAVFGAIASITSGIAWGHWNETLDQCTDRGDYRVKSCGCILYGKDASTYFYGGPPSVCIWVTFGPLIFVLISIGLACFHGFRTCCSSPEKRTRTITTKNEVGEVIELHAVQSEEPSNPLPRAYWIVAATFSVFFTVYALVHFSMFADGYLSTCQQYRRSLEKLMRVSGTAVTVIHGRLGCNAVFDFMDYLQPSPVNVYRESIINTALSLLIGIITSFCSWLFFAAISYINIKFARRSRI